MPKGFIECIQVLCLLAASIAVLGLFDIFLPSRADLLDNLIYATTYVVTIVLAGSTEAHYRPKVQAAHAISSSIVPTLFILLLSMLVLFSGYIPKPNELRGAVFFALAPYSPNLFFCALAFPICLLGWVISRRIIAQDLIKDWR